MLDSAPSMMNENFVRYIQPRGGVACRCDKVLYHYTSLKYGLSDLRCQHIKLSSPGQFNDPLDSIGYYKGNPTQRAFFLYFADLLFKDQVDAMRRDGATNYEIWREYRGFVADAYSRLIMDRNPLSENLIACFCGSEKFKTEVLLWSHYAANCRGLRIGFQFPKGSPYDIRPVRYMGIIPALKFRQLTLHDPESEEFQVALQQFHQEMLCTKHHAWKYEEEFRLITNVDAGTIVEKDGELCFVKLPISYVRFVDFGCRAFGLERHKCYELFLRKAVKLHNELGVPYEVFRLAELEVGKYRYVYVPFANVAKRYKRYYENPSMRKLYGLKWPRGLSGLVS